MNQFDKNSATVAVDRMLNLGLDILGMADVVFVAATHGIGARSMWWIPEVALDPYYADGCGSGIGSPDVSGYYIKSSEYYGYGYGKGLGIGAGSGMMMKSYGYGAYPGSGLEDVTLRQRFKRGVCRGILNGDGHGDGEEFE